MIEPSSLHTIRAAYDSVSAPYAERVSAEMADRPLDRALFSAFAELVRAADVGPVADLVAAPATCRRTCTLWA